MWSKLLTLFVYLVDAIRKQKRQKEQERYEQETIDIRENPAAWYARHFNRDGHSLRNDTDGTDNAAQTSKAGAAKPNSDQ